MILNRANDTDGKEKIAVEYQEGGRAHASTEAVDVGDLKVFAIDKVSKTLSCSKGGLH